MVRFQKLQALKVEKGSKVKAVNCANVKTNEGLRA